MTTDNKKPEKIERRDFFKKTGTGTVAGMIAAGFPAIISGQTVTNPLKLGLVGCGGRGSGAAAQALTADPHNVLTAVADIDEAIVEQATSRLKQQHQVRRPGEDRARVCRARCLRQSHQQRRRRRAAGHAARIPAAAPDRGGERQQACLLRKAVRDRFARRARRSWRRRSWRRRRTCRWWPGFCWRYNNMIQEAVPAGPQRRHRPAGRRTTRPTTRTR